MPKQDPIFFQLKKLNHMMRQPRPTPQSPNRWGQISGELDTESAREWILLSDAESNYIESLAQNLKDDVRFEHLMSPRSVLEQYAWRSFQKKSSDLWETFIDDNAIEPKVDKCFIPVEGLTVTSPIDINGVRFLPTDHPSLPSRELLFDVSLPVRSVAMISTKGTHAKRMVERAQKDVEAVLRRLRIAMRSDLGINTRQLRFRIGESYALEDFMTGVQNRASIVYPIEVTANAIERIILQPVMEIPLNPSNDIDRHVETALRWWERAVAEPDAHVAITFLYFCLEALLGDDSTKLKSVPMILRQSLLCNDVDGIIFSPVQSLELYDTVRSKAVHGEIVRSVDEDVAHQFAFEIQRTIDQFIRLKNREGFTTRRQLRRYLNDHKDRAQMIDFLKSTFGGDWNGSL
jgi:hypothetical protein